MSFLIDFFNITEGRKEEPVCCPFPHRTTTGLEYYETNPSASVNTEDNLFYCQACGKGLSESQFIKEYLGTSVANAKRLQSCFKNMEDLYEWKNETELKPETRTFCNNLGISDEVIDALNLSSIIGEDNGVAFPLFMYDHLTDVRQYIPDHKPKVRSRAGVPAGLILPYDLWRSSMKITLLCAGEKDMAIARSNGFNAITLTGGEQCLPATLEPFRGRKIVIVYDNDNAGLIGAQKVANALVDVAEYVKVCTIFHEGMEEKEDITDYFTKYKHTRQDLIECIKNTPIYIKQNISDHNHYQECTLLEASKPENINKICRTNVQVTAVSEQAFSCPENVLLEKFKISGNNDTMLRGEIREWELKENNAQDILHLMDGNFKEEDIKKHLKDLVRIPQKERCVSVKLLKRCTIFKAYVTDLFETSDTESEQPMEYVCYAINTKLESGKKYTVTHKVTPHPYKGQQLIMIILDAEQANDSVTNFTVTDEVKEQLNVFKKPDNVDVGDHIFNITEKIKGLLGYNGNNTLIETLDLAYHTPLLFNFGTYKDIRGYLDTLIVGESRVGKSSTANCLRKLYGLGTFTSLAGNSATIPGLVGGSNKLASGYQTKAGIIPQNHKGLIIFEEFGKSNRSVITELTDIRSSNEVRITRVSGTITLPALVRMISLTNPKSKEGQIKSIASYPNGIAIVTDLVAAAEDIARYDIILVLSDRGNTEFDPNWVPEEPFPEENYKTRIRWVWSRTPENIVWAEGTELYLQQCASKLNTLYNCHIKIFGTEAWKKLARIAIAMAAYCVSTDESYENILVTQEYIQEAMAYMIDIYDNQTFKLKEYVDHERKYTTVDDDAIALLQTIYDKYPMLILQLEQSTEVTKNSLEAATGLERTDLNKALNSLTKGLFIKITNYEMIPTERFRLGVNYINRDTYTERLGEEVC